MSYFAIAAGDSVQLRNAINELIANERGGERWLALVDRAFDHGGRALRMTDAAEVPLYHTGKLEPLLPVSPVLFELSQDALRLDAQLKRLVRHCRTRPMLGLLRVSCRASELRDSWLSLLELETEDQGGFLLRFADTRVLPTLVSIDEIWNRLAAHVSAWWIIGRDGQLLALPSPKMPTPGNEPLRIGGAAYAALVSAGSVDAMTAYLSEHFPGLLAGLDGYTTYLLLKQLADLCDINGIDGSSEQHALAIATMLTEGRLLETDGFKTWLAEKAWPAGGLEDALEAWITERELA